MSRLSTSTFFVPSLYFQDKELRRGIKNVSQELAKIGLNLAIYGCEVTTFVEN